MSLIDADALKEAIGEHDEESGLEHWHFATGGRTFDGLRAGVFVDRAQVLVLIDKLSAGDKAETPPTEAVRRNLEAIVIRCEEGDKRSDWLPVIGRLAHAALNALQGAAPRATTEPERLDCELAHHGAAPCRAATEPLTRERLAAALRTVDPDADGNLSGDPLEYFGRWADAILAALTGEAT